MEGVKMSLFWLPFIFNRGEETLLLLGLHDSEPGIKRQLKSILTVCVVLLTKLFLNL